MNIKEECEWLYKQIKLTTRQLDEIRKNCPHTKTYIGDYEFRIGQVIKGFICCDCNKFIGPVNMDA